MASPWKSTFVEVPADGATVWIVRIPFFDTPVQATYNDAAQIFQWTNSLSTAVFIDTNLVFKWRPI
jgi:hypothetical protein